jgi:hypothetical protein
VSVNASAGFSVATFTSQASGTGTVGHGLGVAPSLIITKDRSASLNWNTYHSALGATIGMTLNTTNTQNVSSGYWNNTAPTSSVFTLGSSFVGSYSMVAYCWTPIAGFSAMGSYVGNGSSDGTFIYLGFRPKFVLFQNTTSASNWTITDSVVNPYNLSDQHLLPNLSSAQGGSSYGAYDLLSNGIKCRNVATNETNVSGNTYIYMAFAENPFKNALAR